MRPVIFIIAALFFASTSAHAEQRPCTMNITFDTTDAQAGWRAVNDGVMGGKSSGGPRFDNGDMVFEGVINTNGGGFSSVRLDVEPGPLSGAAGLNLRVKSDGRSYKITLKTDARYRFRPVSFQGLIPSTQSGEWADVTVPFSALRASLFGRPVRGAEFNAAAIQEIGIIIADGQDGPFEIRVESISACENGSR